MQENNDNKRVRRSPEERRAFLIKQLEKHDEKQEQKMDAKLQAIIEQIQKLASESNTTSSFHSVSAASWQQFVQATDALSRALPHPKPKQGG